LSLKKGILCSDNGFFSTSKLDNIKKKLNLKVKEKDTRCINLENQAGFDSELRLAFGYKSFVKKIKNWIFLIIIKVGMYN